MTQSAAAHASHAPTRTRDAVNSRLHRLVAWGPDSPLQEALEYALFPGGKRLRPLLTLAAGEACGGEVKPGLLDTACALEMLHCASLILDDLPAMDDCRKRHGKPALHLRFGGSTAILTAHALVSLTFETVAAARLPAEAARGITLELSRTIGARGMAGGQALDLRGESGLQEREVRHTAELKTGCLFRAAAACGALAAGADGRMVDACGAFGLHMGIAYQAADDLVDRNGEDHPERSVNAASALGESAAERLFVEEIGAAHASLRRLDHARPLREWADALEAHCRG